jgi:hypothetical protein
VFLSNWSITKLGFGVFEGLFLIGGLPTALAFPCFLIGLLALPLCGAAHLLSLRPQESKESGSHRKPVVGHHEQVRRVVRDETVSRATRDSDKGLIHPLRAARSVAGITYLRARVLAGSR